MRYPVCGLTQPDCSLFPALAACRVFIGPNTIDSGSPKLSPEEAATKDLTAILDHPSFSAAGIRPTPSMMYLSLANGKATGGELPRGEFLQGWANNEYYIIDADRSWYRVHSDEPGCCGEVRRNKAHDLYVVYCCLLSNPDAFKRCIWSSEK